MSIARLGREVVLVRSGSGFNPCHHGVRLPLALSDMLTESDM